MKKDIWIVEIINNVTKKVETSIEHQSKKSAEKAVKRYNKNNKGELYAECYQY